MKLGYHLRQSVFSSMNANWKWIFYWNRMKVPAHWLHVSFWNSFQTFSKRGTLKGLAYIFCITRNIWNIRSHLHMLYSVIRNYEFWFATAIIIRLPSWMLYKKVDIDNIEIILARWSRKESPKCKNLAIVNKNKGSIAFPGIIKVRE